MKMKEKGWLQLESSLHQHNPFYVLSCTEQALRELMKHLDKQPDMYKSILKKRRRDEKENEGIMSYIKVL